MFCHISINFSNLNQLWVTSRSMQVAWYYTLSSKLTKWRQKGLYATIWNSASHSPHVPIAETVRFVAYTWFELATSLRLALKPQNLRTLKAYLKLKAYLQVWVRYRIRISAHHYAESRLSQDTRYLIQSWLRNYCENRRRVKVKPLSRA